jgi:hypothetical protein
LRLRGKAVGSLTEGDIRALIDNGVAESQVVEYKRELPGSADADKREFLADVSAFANTAGGCILYGVETARDANQQDTGVPTALPGLPGANLDKEKLRLEGMLQDGLSPALRGLIRFQDLPSTNADPVLVMGIPSSYAAPHRVTYQKVNKFWRRSEGGKYEPDVTELKRMFLETSTWSDEAEQFRAERSEKVRKRGLINVNLTSSVFIHVLPLGRLNARIDLKQYEEKLRSLLSPPTNKGWGHRWDVDGFMTSTLGKNNLLDTYTQWFRFGGVEGYSADYLRNWEGNGKTVPIFQARQLTIMLERYVPEAVTAMREIFDHQAPYAVGVSVHNVRGSYIVVKENRLGEPIDQNDIVPPLVVVDESDPVNVRTALRPIVDTLWQSGGFAEEPVTA